jgi:hypothetical protein
MQYPMKCPECGYETTSMEVPIEQGPPVMFCLLCALKDEPVLVRLRRVYVAVAAHFHGGGWASKS